MADSEFEMIWEAPPANQGRGRNKVLAKFLEELKAKPGEWARYPSRMSYGWGYGVVGRNPGLECAARNLVPVDGKSKSYTCDTYFRFTEA